MKNLWVIPLGLALGCAQPADRSTAEQKPAMRAMGESVTVEDARSDESIGAEIRRRMETGDAAGTSSVIIEVEDGVVTLRGAATNLTAAWHAEALARSVPGVKDIRNRIIIQQGP